MMKVNRESFLSHLESVSPGTTKKEELEQSSCFIFRGGKVFTFNDNVSCQNKSLLDKSYAGAVVADPLLSILRKMTVDEVELNLTESKFTIKGKGERSWVGMSPNIVLPIDSLEVPKKWKTVHEDFIEAINVVQRTASNSPASPFCFKCIQISPKFIEATDNFQMCRWTLDTGIQQKVLVRKEDIKHITTLGINQFSEGESWLHFRNSNGLIYSCRRYLEEFPDLSPYLVEEGEKAILPKSLIQAVEKASVFTSEEGESNYVKVELSSGKVRVLGQGASGGYKKTSKIDYDGKEVSFIIAPKLFTELLKRYSECLISEFKIVVVSGNYFYLTCLNKPEKKE